MIYKWDAPITTIVLHNTAVSRAVQPLQLDAVNTHHKNKDWGGGWKQTEPSELGFYVGYNFFCEPTGTRTQTRKIGEQTIAQIGNNCDVPGRCGMVSYCMAGYFKVEKPTQHQINDFIKFYWEIKAKYPKVVVKQHKDVHPGRTCAELSDAEIQSWLKPETEQEKLDRLYAQIVQLQAMVEVLLKNKKR